MFKKNKKKMWVYDKEKMSLIVMNDDEYEI